MAEGNSQIPQSYDELLEKFSERKLSLAHVPTQTSQRSNILYGSLDGMFFRASFYGEVATLSLGMFYDDSYYLTRFYDAYEKWLANMESLKSDFESGVLAEEGYHFARDLVMDMEPKVELPHSPHKAPDIRLMYSETVIPSRTAKPPWRALTEVDKAPLMDSLITKLELFTHE